MMLQEYRSSRSHSVHTNLVDLLRARSDQQTDQCLYTFLSDGETQEEHLTYGELDRQARAIAATLQSLGATGERVLLLYPSGLEYIAAFFGCLYAGAVAVPVYPPRMHHGLDRIRAIVADAQASVALTETSLALQMQRWLAQTPDLQRLHWVVTGKEPDGMETAWSRPAISGESLAFLQYTSGSTGTPKGVMLSHRNVLYNQRMIQRAFRHTERSIGVGWLPLYHDMGLIGNVLQPLYAGFPCVLMSPMAFLQRPVRWLQAITRYQATTSGGPNFAYDLCVRKVTPEQRATLDLSSWEIAYNGAEPVRHDTMERFTTTFAACGFHHDTFYPCYGLAEATLLVTGGQKQTVPVRHTVRRTALEYHRALPTSPHSHNAHTLVSCGQTLLEQSLVIVNPQDHTPCLPGQVGEIWVAGPSVAQGYWRRPEATEETFRARLASQPGRTFLRTGDLGFVRHDELFVTGRLKDVIIIRGANHYPQDIEATVAQSHTALQASSGAAFTVEVAGEERLVIAQEMPRTLQRAHRQGLTLLHPNATARTSEDDIERILGNIRQAVSAEHGLQVQAIYLLPTGSIPKTSSGKIQRHACRTAFLQGTWEVLGAWPAVPTSANDIYTIPAPPEHALAESRYSATQQAA